MVHVCIVLEEARKLYETLGKPVNIHVEPKVMATAAKMADLHGHAQAETTPKHMMVMADRVLRSLAVAKLVHDLGERSGCELSIDDTSVVALSEALEVGGMDALRKSVTAFAATAYLCEHKTMHTGYMRSDGSMVPIPLLLLPPAAIETLKKNGCKGIDKVYRDAVMSGALPDMMELAIDDLCIHGEGMVLDVSKDTRASVMNCYSGVERSMLMYHMFSTKLVNALTMQTGDAILTGRMDKPAVNLIVQVEGLWPSTRHTTPVDVCNLNIPTSQGISVPSNVVVTLHNAVRVVAKARKVTLCFTPRTMRLWTKLLHNRKKQLAEAAKINVVLAQCQAFRILVLCMLVSYMERNFENGKKHVFDVDSEVDASKLDTIFWNEHQGTGIANDSMDIIGITNSMQYLSAAIMHLMHCNDSNSEPWWVRTDCIADCVPYNKSDRGTFIEHLMWGSHFERYLSDFSPMLERTSGFLLDASEKGDDQVMHEDGVKLSQDAIKIHGSRLPQKVDTITDVLQMFVDQRHKSSDVQFSSAVIATWGSIALPIVNHCMRVLFQTLDPSKIPDKAVVEHAVIPVDIL